MFDKSLPSLWMSMVILFLALQYPFMAAGIHTLGQAQLFSLQPSERKIDQAVYKSIHTMERKMEIKPQNTEKAKLENMEQVNPLPLPAVSLEAERKEQQKINETFISEIKTKDVTRLDLRKPSGLTAVQADQLLKGTGLEGLGKAFVEAEKEYKVNAYYLMAHAAWESAWGKSRLSKEKNNLFGFMAYDGSAYRSAKTFKTKEESIHVVAQYVSDQYLSKGGKYYNGSHLKGMNVRYATDSNWGKGIGKVMSSLAKKTKQPLQA